MRRLQTVFCHMERTAIALLTALSILASGAACSAENKAQMHVTRARPSPEILLEEATAVVRVKIVSSEPVHHKGKDGPSCGYRHFAEVVETVKGNLTTDAEFLWDERLATGGNYLVALRDFTGEVPEEIDDPLLPESVAENLRCRIQVSIHAVDVARMLEADGRWWASAAGTRMIPQSASRRVSDGRISWEILRSEILKTIRSNAH